MEIQRQREERTFKFRPEITRSSQNVKQKEPVFKRLNENSSKLREARNIRKLQNKMPKRAPAVIVKDLQVYSDDD